MTMIAREFVYNNNNNNRASSMIMMGFSFISYTFIFSLFFMTRI
jgi:hypothetical protein